MKFILEQPNEFRTMVHGIAESLYDGSKGLRGY
jgi:hypothetical protein